MTVEGDVNLGEETKPRQAAAVILVRGGGKHSQRGLEVLMVRRNLSSKFMPGVWVFPGGAVDISDSGNDEQERQTTARRELAEEASIELEPEVELHPFSRWVTPAILKKRYDSVFYVARAPAHTPPKIDGEEVIDARWFTPTEALELSEKGGIDLAFPTVAKLKTLSEYQSAQALIDSLDGTMPEPIQPRVVGSGDNYKILMPGEPGYEDGV